MNTLIGSDTRVGRNRSASMENPDGVSVASPTPTNIRATKSCQNDRARPQAVAAAVHITMPMAISERRLPVSASRPSGTAASA